MHRPQGNAPSCKEHCSLSQIALGSGSSSRSKPQQNVEAERKGAHHHTALGNRPSLLSVLRFPRPCHNGRLTYNRLATYSPHQVKSQKRDRRSACSYDYTFTTQASVRRWYRLSLGLHGITHYRSKVCSFGCLLHSLDRLASCACQ